MKIIQISEVCKPFQIALSWISKLKYSSLHKGSIKTSFILGWKTSDQVPTGYKIWMRISKRKNLHKGSPCVSDAWSLIIISILDCKMRDRLYDKSKGWMNNMEKDFNLNMVLFDGFTSYHLTIHFELIKR